MTGCVGQAILGQSMSDSPAHLQVLSSDEFINQDINGREINLEAIFLSAERVTIHELFQEAFYNQVSKSGSELVEAMLLGKLAPGEVLEELEKLMQ